MNRHLVATVMFIGIAACATSGPESGNSETIAAAPLHESDARHAGSTNESADFMRATAAPDIAGENSIYCRKKKLTSLRRVQGACITPPIRTESGPHPG